MRFFFIIRKLTLERANPMQDVTPFKAFFEASKAQKFSRFSKILEPLLTQYPMPVIVFCDPGVDDALMLLQLLGAQSLYKVVGIIPVKGNISSQVCLENTLELCEYIGRTDVPVYPGRKAEFTGVAVYGDRAMGSLVLPKAEKMKAQQTPGIEFAVEYLKHHQALIISTGGLTEPAEVLQKLSNDSPAALKNIRGISLMGGVINSTQEANFPVKGIRTSEFNVADDPEATKQFFDITAQYGISIFLQPLDLTHSALVSKTDVASLENINHPAAKAAYTLISNVPDHYQKRYKKGPDGEYRQPLHDLHSSTCLLHPELYRGRWVELEVSRDPSHNHFSIKKEGTGNVFLLSIPTPDRKKFIDAIVKDYKNTEGPDFIIDLVKKSRQAFLATPDSSPNFLKIYKATSRSGKTYTVFGVKKEDQVKVNYAELRMQLAKEMGFASNTNFIQFIGDSSLYSENGTQKGANIVAHELETTDKDSIVLYGYTGSRNSTPGRPRREVNQLVSDWTDAESISGERSSRVLANIVDEHTMTAIQSWGCTVSENVNHFFLVYSDTPTPSVKFGDDVCASDNITNHKATALDGGIQSFLQMINMICNDVPVQGITDLRDLSNHADMRRYDPQSKLPYLSAVEFLIEMKNKIIEFNGEITESVLDNMAADYLATHALYNRNKGDSETNQALWDTAWEKFVTVGWKKIELFSPMDEAITAEAIHTKTLSSPRQGY
jgi:inosine-uridine nucleoside N-ribohydrolase